ncbi:MAG: hypothetical protein IJS52_07970 [Bacilli bacterium]|nr:hypothetical protein [Bacilli bacterium]
MVGGNYNNGSNDGPVYFNLNNDWGNANYNIGLRPFLPHPAQIIERKHISAPMRSLDESPEIQHQKRLGRFILEEPELCKEGASMRRVGDIHEKAFDKANILAAIDSLSKSKASKEAREYLKKNRESLAEDVLANPHFDGRFRRFKRKEGQKVRDVFEPSIHDQIIAKAIVRVIIPILRPREYFHSYAAMAGKGPILARNAVARYLKRDWARWFCKIDVVRCFPTFPHRLVLSCYDRIFKDPKVRELIVEDLQAYSRFAGTEDGLALGEVTSQEWCNLAMTFACFRAKQEAKVPGLVEYMDDFVLVGRSKRELTKQRDAFRAILASMGFRLHDELDDVKPLEYVDKRGKRRGEAVDICGYRVYKRLSTLRRSLYKKIRRCIIRMKARKPDERRAKRFFSFYGFLLHSASRKVFEIYGITEQFIERAKAALKGENTCKSC